MGSIGNELDFSFSQLPVRTRPYDILLHAENSYGSIFNARTTLRRLPEPRYSRSISRIDSLYGGISARIGPSTWTTVFPYSFYVGGPWLRESPFNMQILVDHGYNILHIVPSVGLGYDLFELDAWLEEADRIGLWIMLDMRWSYTIPKNIQILVTRVQRHRNLLLWYTADEPGKPGPKNGDRRTFALAISMSG